MKKTPKNQQEKGNIYDRIFRENAQSIFLPLIKSELGIDIHNYQRLETKISKTLEREVDFLYKISDKKDRESILHIEFQTKNDKEMLARIQEYHGLIYRKMQLPILHIVIFLGKGKSTMPAKLETSHVFRGFRTINLYELDKQKLLETNIPEMIIMAILSDYKEERIENILSLITERLKKVSRSEDTLRRYLRQLFFLARIRNLETETINYIEDMPITYDIKKDILYLRGVKQGVEQGLKQGVEQGIEQTNKKAVLKMHKAGMNSQDIADFLDLDHPKVLVYINEA